MPLVSACICLCFICCWKARARATTLFNRFHWFYSGGANPSGGILADALRIRRRIGLVLHLPHRRYSGGDVGHSFRLISGFCLRLYARQFTFSAVIENGKPTRFALSVAAFIIAGGNFWLRFIFAIAAAIIASKWRLSAIPRRGMAGAVLAAAAVFCAPSGCIKRGRQIIYCAFAYRLRFLPRGIYPSFARIVCNNAANRNNNNGWNFGFARQ